MGCVFHRCFSFFGVLIWLGMYAKLSLATSNGSSSDLDAMYSSVNYEQVGVLPFVCVFALMVRVFYCLFFFGGKKAKTFP